jgi:hypothetical protein
LNCFTVKGAILQKKIIHTGDRKNILQIRETDFTSRTPLFEKSQLLKGQSHEKDGKMRVWGVSLGPK